MSELVLGGCDITPCLLSGFVLAMRAGQFNWVFENHRYEDSA